MLDTLQHRKPAYNWAQDVVKPMTLGRTYVDHYMS